PRQTPRMPKDARSPKTHKCEPLPFQNESVRRADRPNRVDSSKYLFRRLVHRIDHPDVAARYHQHPGAIGMREGTRGRAETGREVRGPTLTVADAELHHGPLASEPPPLGWECTR